MRGQEGKRMADFKVRCVEAVEDYTTEGKIYEVKDGIFTCDIGRFTGRFNNVEEMNEEFTSQFELVTDPQQFTKADLKTGMRVELRNGQVYIILKDFDTVTYGHQDIFLARNSTFMIGSDYSDDLTRSKINKSQYDIISVFDSLSDSWLLDINKKGKLLWQRPEPITYTVEEAEAALTEAEGNPVVIVR